MHRFGKGVDPRDDTNRKMRALGRLRDGHKVLDICTGLGYTAICASAGGADVTTIELDAAMQRMCRLNPWSAPLFSDDITQLMGDATELVRSMPDETFDRIIHDPPTFALAGELYSREFYTQLNRILTANGKLFHYVGDPDSRAAGKHFQGIIRRLQEAGFEGAATDYDAHGVVASHRARRGTRSRRARKPAARGDGGGGGAVPEGRRRSKHRGNATMLRDTIREAQEEEP
jgi:predicted methyltransferase